jgi:hypothetical protein
MQPRRPLSYHPTPVCPQRSRVSSFFCPLPIPPHSSALLSFKAVFPTALFWGHGGHAYSSGGFHPAFGACALDCGRSSASLPRLKLFHGEIKGGHPVLFSDRSLARSFETGPFPDMGACWCLSAKLAASKLRASSLTVWGYRPTLRPHPTHVRVLGSTRRSS